MSALNCFLQNKAIVCFLAVIIIYFLVMDINLYRHIQAIPPLKPRATSEPAFSSPNLSTSSTRTRLKFYSPFEKLSMKTIMLDPTNQYIYNPLVVMFDRVTRLSSTIYFITPNFISVCHFLIALVAAKFVSSEKLYTRQIGVLLFEFRTLLDALDGFVARTRSRIDSDTPDFRSIGYYVDGVSDTLGTIALMHGIHCYLQRQSMNNNNYSLLSPRKSNGFDILESKSRSWSSSVGHHLRFVITNKKILGTVICFGFQLTISSLFWNRTISIYNDLLESFQPTEGQSVLQNDVLKSVLMCSIFWCWRLSNAHALLEYLLLSVFIDKAWEFMTWIQYLGFVIFGCLIFITETHYHYAKVYINTPIT